MSNHHGTEPRPILTSEGSNKSAGGDDGRHTHVVEFRDVSLSFGAKLVLDDVSLTVDRQERLVIIGQSGMGKTTILRLILGVIQPTSGLVTFEGKNLSQLTQPELRQMRTRIGMVYQDAALLSSISVRDNLACPYRS
jgi:phospholipid/cholesterol/gamma-HCH transport system ATP-binding protein